MPFRNNNGIADNIPCRSETADAAVKNNSLCDDNNDIADSIQRNNDSTHKPFNYLSNLNDKREHEKHLIMSLWIIRHVSNLLEMKLKVLK